MSEALGEVYCLLAPLVTGRLLLTRGCVAEVVGYQLPGQVPGVPPWYLGTVRWNNAQIPLVSFEACCRQPVAEASSRSRIMVLNALGDRLGSAHYGVLVQGFPQLLRISAGMLSTDSSYLQDSRQPVVCRVRMLKDTPLIPDLERLEAMIADETPAVA